MKPKAYHFRNITVVAFLILHCISFAQSDFLPETYLGVKQGMNISRVSFDPAVSQDIFSGYVGGLVFRHISQRSLGIQVELNFLQAGWKTHGDTLGKYERRLSYLQLPLLTQINIGNRKSRVIINLGPNFAYLLSENETTDIDPNSEEIPFVGMKVRNIFDYGLCFDIGFMQKTAIGSFQISGRMIQSLNSLFETAGDAPYRASMNQIFEINLMYMLELKDIFGSKLQ
ncbi:MAG: PorT family protein [Bacteroidetes bacterium]|nr:PorT family protein [Bacteroidota bacterium]